jgi:Secretion system C-terminal sorting domain/Glycosyl hydrolases family 16
MKKTILLSAFLLINLLLNAQPPQTPAGMRWVPVPELTDEFNGTVLDASKWDDYHPNWSGRAPSAFKKGNAYVKDGKLCLRSGIKRDPSTVNNPLSDVWVDAAACVSKNKSAKPGYYYEAYMKASDLSMTSSFWFRVGSFSEIDVIEHIGHPSVASREDDLPYQYHANTHIYGTRTGASKAAEVRMNTRGRDEYHLYGFWWKDPRTLWFYHNGVKVMEIKPNTTFDENLKMIFDTEVFPFATAGVANIGLPTVASLNDNTKNTAYIDYVRTYKLVDNTLAVESNLYDNGLSLYPNPVEDKLFLNFNDSKSVSKVEVYSLDGKQLLSYKLNSNQEVQEFNLQTLAKGVYIVRIKDSNDKIIDSSKIIKE